jgi:branched-chain amino acid transport system substrate-binding protein
MSALRRLLAVAVAAACLAPASASAMTLAAPPPFTIGAAFSQTGSAAPYGASQIRGAQLAAAGTDVRVVVRDDASTPAGATAAFTRLMDDGAQALLGPTLSTAALAADPLAQSRGVPVLGVSNTVDGLTGIGTFVFRDSLPESLVQPQAVKIAKQRLHLRRVAIVYATPDAYSKASNAVFRKALRANGITVTADRAFASTSERALDAALDAAARTKPDALVISALQGDVVNAMIGARRRAALKQVPFIGGNAFNAPGLYEQTKGAADGAISGTAWFRGQDTPGNAAFVGAYRAAYGTTPDQFAAQAYAGVKLIVAARAKGGALRDALAGLRGVPTVLGDFSFDADREPQYEPTVVQLRHGKQVRIG